MIENSSDVELFVEAVMNYSVVIGFLFVISIVALVLLFKTKIKVAKLKKKYLPILNIDEAVEKSKKDKLIIENDIKSLQKNFSKKKLIYDRLLKQISIFDEELEMSELGFYKPHFDFGTSEEFKEKINKCREKQKIMLKDKKAIYCSQEWTLDGSKAKGRTLTNRNIKLTSRAFNNECDTLIANVRWNNILKFEERMLKAKQTIEKMNESNKIYIDNKYLALKLEELRLTHEYRDKKQKEKEEQAEIKRQIREEAKLQQDVEVAAKEELKYKNLLLKTQKEAEKAVGEKLEKLKLTIKNLELDLKEAQEKNEKAISMAQQTKSGYVYVISNIGSFGENVYKIGMTRRLEPMDRVRELSDASVPFSFDVHAMIYSNDAPKLENILHKKFDENRLNLVNNRKEFFHITLIEIEEEVKKEFPDAEFVLTAEAREYRETQALKNKKNVVKEDDIPSAI